MKSKKLMRVDPHENMKLHLFYENGETRIFDVSPYAKRSWYGELSNPDYFQSVKLLPGGSGIAWPNGQDIAPHELYESSQTLGQEASEAAIDAVAAEILERFRPAFEALAK